MKHVEIGKIYRHFKGNYYFVENVGADCETCEPVVIYKALYNNSSSQIWVRPEKDFLGEISLNRPDNILGQTHKFELVKEFNKDYTNKGE